MKKQMEKNNGFFKNKTKHVKRTKHKTLFEQTQTVTGKETTRK